MRTTTSGLLLFLIAAIAFAGFLSGRLNDWLGYLFSPASTSSAPTATTSSVGGVSSILPVTTLSQGAGVGLSGSYSTAKVG